MLCSTRDEAVRGCIPVLMRRGKQRWRRTQNRTTSSLPGSWTPCSVAAPSLVEAQGGRDGRMLEHRGRGGGWASGGAGRRWAGHRVVNGGRWRRRRSRCPPCEGREATRSACACACVLVLGLCCRWAIVGTWIYTFETLCIF